MKYQIYFNGTFQAEYDTLEMAFKDVFVTMCDMVNAYLCEPITIVEAKE